MDDEPINKWTTEQLWNELVDLKADPENEVPDPAYQEAKLGKRIKVHIAWLINEGWTKMHPSNKKAVVKGYGQYNLVDLQDELDHRKSLMRRLISEHTNHGEIIAGR